MSQHSHSENGKFKSSQTGMLSNKHIFVEYPSESITNITDSHINCREMYRQLPILLNKK